LRASGALLLAAAALAAGPGCTLLPFGGGANAGAAGKPSPMGHGLLELRAAFHVHCYLSHDSRGRIEEIAEAARSLGLDTVILSDHYAPRNIERAPRGIQHDVLFLPGVELRAGKGGSILAFPLESDFSNDVSPAGRLAEMARQGAVSVMGHVEEDIDWNLGPFQAFEVYNLHAQFKAVSRWAIAGRLLAYPADAFFEAAIENPVSNLETWDRELARGRKLAALAGHDAHANVRLFGPLGGTIGTYPELLRLFSNHILAAARTVEDVARAVRAGRTFVSFDYLADGTGFSMSYGEAASPMDGRAILGDSVPFLPGASLQISVPDAGSDSPRTRVLRDGRSLLETSARSFDLTLPGPGVYRAEVYLENRLWIVSSPVYITP
jgi:hypothetical protein